MNRWRVILEDLIRFGQMGHRLYLGRETMSGDVEMVVPPLTLKSLDRASFLSDSDALLDDSKSFAGSSVSVRDFLQAMSDAAWDIGIKPKQLESHSSELKAVRDHLNDMRKLAKVTE